MNRSDTPAPSSGGPAPAWLARLLGALAAVLFFGLAPARAQEPAFVPTRFSVEVSGDGADVILIPGLSTSREVWRTAAERLGPGYRVHLVQVKGFGEPAGPNAQGPVLQPLVEELAQYIAQIAPERPAVVGHSLGGLMALMLGTDHPELPGKLMIVDAFPWFGATVAPASPTVEAIEPQARQMRDALVASYGTAGGGRSADGAIAAYVLDPAKLPLLRAWTAGADPRVTGQLFYEDMVTDLRTRIVGIRAPVTVVYPWNERSPTKEQAEAFYRAHYAALPSARFVGIGPAAHFLMTDQPEAFQTELERFLEK